MKTRKVDIISQNRIYDGYIKIDEALISDAFEGCVSTYKRQKALVPDAVAGLIYNTSTQSVVLTRQYRYPIHFQNRSGFIYEALAGRIDKGETPMLAFIRESLEETGYNLKEKNVKHCFSCFTSPGYSTERIHYFLATATNRDKIENAGGGIKDENENIEVHELHYLQFKSMIDTMEDSKTKLLAYEAHYRNFFDAK